MKKIIAISIILTQLYSNLYSQVSFTKLDIATGSSSANPRKFIEYNNQLYFTALGNNVSGIGDELFVTNGTQASTQLVSNINPSFGAGSSLENLTVYNNELYFSAFTNANGRELYKTNGTTVTLVKDIAVGTEDGIENSTFIELNGLLYFFAQDTTGTGFDLWRTDGTTNGTVKMVNLNSNNIACNKLYFRKLNNELYFLAQDINDITVGIELYKYNSTNNTVSLVIDVVAGNGQTSTTSYGFFTVFDNKLFFVAEGKLRYTDGITTSIVTNGASNLTGYFKLKVFNSQLIFIANSSNNGSHDIYKCTYDSALSNYKIDLVYNFTQTAYLPFASPSSDDGFEVFTEVNNKLYFAARESSSPNAGVVFQIYATDGITTNVAVPITYTGSPSVRSINFITAVQGKLYYQSSGTNSPDQLWEANPTTGTYIQITNYTPQTNVPEQVSTRSMFVFKNELYFEAQKIGDGYELWKINNTTLPSYCHSFTGKINQQKVDLQWTVSNQINTKEFVLEKSIDGVMFKSLYTLPAAENRPEQTTYAYSDELIKDQHLYYRVKQIDKDGKWMYLCNTVKITNTSIAKEFSFFPNSASKIILVQLPTELINATITIVNTNGQLVYSKKATTTNHIIDVSNLNNGIYYIQTVKQNIMQSKKLIIQH